VTRRFRPVQAGFDEQAVIPEQDAAGRICEPIAHQRLHSGMDVTVQRQRVENLWHRARARLVLLQKLRHQGLVAGAVALPHDCHMETDGRVFGPIAPKMVVPIPEPEIEEMEADRMAVPPSADGENWKYPEQKETGSTAVPSLGYADAAAARTAPPRTALGVMRGSWCSQSWGARRDPTLRVTTGGVACRGGSRCALGG
jgi:hypothetical protein